MSRIEWTERTWNPVLGCSAASPGCDHCYAATFAHRRLTEAHKGLTVVGEHGPEFNGTVRVLPDRLAEPLRWRKSATVFVCSMSDLFHPQVPPHFVAEVFEVMAEATKHTFQVLTKRPQRMREALSDPDFILGGSDYHGPWPLPNVWLGASIESDRYAWRADHVRATPAAIRFLSLEPLLGPLPSLDFAGIDWVIIGGESGPGARRMDLDWCDDIVARAREAGALVFLKQLGAHYRQPGDPKAGKLSSIPVGLQLREMPSPTLEATRP